ncbi:hypothetical protein EJ05DRAFT_8527 [Pseudovirgaria hyperparasitica]|uniref:Uncharacterized protein n=1 Tax=Pseudovirgaria hyperparasitica TaxID=470096 RepID=A0A6A6WKE9_9PEZI|nr:uncharacterized protein EJ05DRAFT_8527 [Pseudovirgaria hyperparasitica]KAF2762660.1 hypothetical protein EJ05DRAFT_8527 [Pseudovirgaria hyperparasitica]
MSVSQHSDVSRRRAGTFPDARRVFGSTLVYLPLSNLTRGVWYMCFASGWCVCICMYMVMDVYMYTPPVSSYPIPFQVTPSHTNHLPSPFAFFPNPRMTNLSL